MFVANAAAAALTKFPYCKYHYCLHLQILLVWQVSFLLLQLLLALANHQVTNSLVLMSDLFFYIRSNYSCLLASLFLSKYMLKNIDRIQFKLLKVVMQCILIMNLISRNQIKIEYIILVNIHKLIDFLWEYQSVYIIFDENISCLIKL